MIAYPPCAQSAPIPEPSERHYAALGLRHGATVARCIEAFDRLAPLCDPRAWPGSQHWAIARQDEIDEAMALIYDSATSRGGRAA